MPQVTDRSSALEVLLKVRLGLMGLRDYLNAHPADADIAEHAQSVLNSVKALYQEVGSISPYDCLIYNPTNKE